MTDHVFDPEHPFTRRLINQHKTMRMKGIEWAIKRQYFLNDREECYRAYIEQCGDLEIYRELYEESKKIDEETKNI